MCYFVNVFSPFSESVGEILQEVGRGFLLLTWARGSFPRKNMVSSLLIPQLSLSPYHSEHPVQTGLTSILKQSKKICRHNSPLLLCPCAIKSNIELIKRMVVCIISLSIECTQVLYLNTLKEVFNFVLKRGFTGHT